MENKKNKNLGLALIAIFISILSIFISILKFNGANHNSNYLLNGQQTHVVVEPIKHNKIVSDNDKVIKYSKSIFISNDYEFVITLASTHLTDFNNTFFELIFIDKINNYEYLLFNIEYDLKLLNYFNDIDIMFSFEQIDNLEFNIYCAITFYGVPSGDSSYSTIDHDFNYDLPLQLYHYFYNNYNDLSDISYFYGNQQFYFAQLFNNNDYNGTLFDNISLIATKVGAILVATLTPIITLLFANGKLTIVGASLAMALGVGAIYLIFRMVRGLIKQNERG